MQRSKEVTDVAIPAGFRLYVHKGTSYFQTLGDLYVRERPDGLPVIGLYVKPQHCNRLGIAHGGMLATLADTALGMGLHLARPTRATMVTVNLSLDYMAASQVGEWLEAHVTPRRLGRQLAYGDCVLRVGEREVLRATGIFSVVSRALPVIESDG